MKKFLILGAFVAVALVSCKEKAAETPAVETPAVETPAVETPAVDTTAAMPADTTAKQ